MFRGRSRDRNRVLSKCSQGLAILKQSDHDNSLQMNKSLVVVKEFQWSDFSSSSQRNILVHRMVRSSLKCNPHKQREVVSLFFKGTDSGCSHQYIWFTLPGEKWPPPKLLFWFVFLKITPEKPAERWSFRAPGRERESIGFELPKSLKLSANISL